MYRFGTGMFLVNPYIFASGAPALDPDADAFLTAAGITDPTIEGAINTLVVDMKTAGIWTKMKAVYPFVGGNATSHKYNLIDTSLYELNFVGGFTHNANGITGNGSNAVAGTGLFMSSLSLNSTHISIYNRTNNASAGLDMGGSDALFSNGLYFSVKFTDNIFYNRNNSSTNATPLINTDPRGFYVSTRVVSTGWKVFKNNSLFTTGGVSTGLSSRSVFISAYDNDGNITNYSNRNYAFASIGDGLSDTEASDLYTAVNTFQTTLSRNV